MNGTIIRVVKERNYAVIANDVLRDSRLSWAARGILAYLLSKPNNWKVLTADLVKQGPAGRGSVLGKLKELETYGYLRRRKIRTDGGKWGWITEVFEQPTVPNISIQSADYPETENPTTDNPSLDNPTTENRTTKEQLTGRSTEVGSTQSSSTYSGVSVKRQAFQTEKPKEMLRLKLESFTPGMLKQFERDFAWFWRIYPQRVGTGGQNTRGNKILSQLEFADIRPTSWAGLVKAALVYADSEEIPKNAEKWLHDEHWVDWLEAGTAQWGDMDVREFSNINEYLDRKRGVDGEVYEYLPDDYKAG